MVTGKLTTQSYFSFGIFWSEIYQNSLLHPTCFFPLQMGNFVLWIKLYWLWAYRFFSLNWISLHTWNLFYVSILEKDMENNIICGRKKSQTFKNVPLSTTFLPAASQLFWCLLWTPFHVLPYSALLLEKDFSSTLQTALAFATHQVHCWMSTEHALSCGIWLESQS